MYRSCKNQKVTQTTNPHSTLKTSPLIIVNKRVKRSLTVNTATLDVQVLRTDDGLLERGVESCMEEGSILEEVKDKMFDDMTQFEMRNRRLNGPFDYQFERERIYNHNRWKQSILGVFNPLKVREVAFRSLESIARRYRVPEEVEKDSLLGSDHVRIP